MTIREKLEQMREIEARNDERIREFVQQERCGDGATDN